MKWNVLLFKAELYVASSFHTLSLEWAIMFKWAWVWAVLTFIWLLTFHRCLSVCRVFPVSTDASSSFCFLLSTSEIGPSPFPFIQDRKAAIPLVSRSSRCFRYEATFTLKHSHIAIAPTLMTVLVCSSGLYQSDPINLSHRNVALITIIIQL